MMPSSLSPTHSIFEIVYDKYSSMLYGILLQICSNKEAAEKVLVATFQKLNSRHNPKQNHPCLFVILIKLAMETAAEQMHLKQPVVYTLFKESPLLQKLLFNNAGMKDCEEFLQVDKTSVGKMLRQEILLLRERREG